MSRSSFLTKHFAASLLTVGLCAAAVVHAQDSETSHRGRKYKAPPPTSRVEVTVLRATNGKPVENAAVIFHPLVDGKDSGNMELKTNDEGKAVIDLLNLNSSVRLQIIAPGYQTFGEDFKIDKDTMAIEIKLKRPAEQYSIYKKSEGRVEKPADGAAKPEDSPKDAGAKDAAAKNPDPKDAAADAKPDTTPDTSKPQPAAPK